MTWSAAQYLKFEDERNRPVRDLLAALPPLDAQFAVDLGCGPGNSTELLAQRFPLARVRGLDNSADMIGRARGRLPQIEFELTDIDGWLAREPARSDVILANAVLQWLPDHAALLPALLAKLSAGGVLAVQMPDNLDEPAHRLMREVAADGPWRGKLAAAMSSRAPLEPAAWYYDLLRSRAARVEVWRTTYHHPLPDVAAIVEWFKGSGLRPFLDPLDAREREAYLERYSAALERAHAPFADGSVLLPFPRLFVMAVR